MLKLIKILCGLIFLANLNLAFAGEIIQTCKTTEPTVDFDYNYFKLTQHSNEYTKWYTYLSDSVLLGYNNAEKTRAHFFSIDLVLLDKNKLVINYNETNAYSEDGACWAHYEETFTDTLETAWSSVDDKLHVEGYGRGEAIICNGKPALSFTYDKNIGPGEIEGKNYVLTYGRSNISPVKDLLKHPCP
ncbi:hypothetical protein N9W41_01365 [bacterium]|nr:hypothetical protein [bacterium]